MKRRTIRLNNKFIPSETRKSSNKVIEKNAA